MEMISGNLFSLFMILVDPVTKFAYKSGKLVGDEENNIPPRYTRGA